MHEQKSNTLTPPSTHYTPMEQQKSKDHFGSLDIPDFTNSVVPVVTLPSNYVNLATSEIEIEEQANPLSPLTDGTSDVDTMEGPVPVHTPVTPPSGPAVAHPRAGGRPHSSSLSSRRPALRVMISSDQQADFSAAIQAARANLTSDAAKLPKSTNMGLGNKGPPQQATKTDNGERGSAAERRSNATQAAAPGLARPKTTQPWPIPQPVTEKERPKVLTEHEQTMRTHDSQSHSWEESETFERRTPASRSPESPKGKAVFLRAIPCMYVNSVSNAVSFYKDILGFSTIGKPDASYAELVHTPSPAVGQKPRGTMKQAPVDAVQIYIRIAPMGSNGERVKPPPTTVWILVSDVDEVFAEIQARWTKFQPRTDEYFPMHSFGDAKILAKPQNKAWGNRELHVVDGDENKIIFFCSLR